MSAPESAPGPGPAPGSGLGAVLDRVGGEPRVLVRRLDPGVPIPAYAHPGDAGADLVTTRDVALAPGERAMVPTGIALALPQGYAAFVHPRSGLAARSGVSLVNAPGTIDAGYRGEVQVILINLDPRKPLQLRRGDRIAQLVIQRVHTPAFELVDELPETVRGVGGFGSTGMAAAAAEHVPATTVPGRSHRGATDAAVTDDIPREAACPSQ